MLFKVDRQVQSREIADSITNMSAVEESSKPWIEKYRPRKLADVSAQDEVVAVLRNTVQSKNLPHLLFYGPPGTGKTSTILALAHELYGPKIIRSRILELNASDERGINIVREKVKNFARITSTQVDPNYPSPPYKIVILDEADSMTPEAQSALRRTMEDYSKTTRFCLICNYSSKIIAPLASRCARFRFKPLPTEDIKGRISFIAEKEGIHYEDSTIDELINVSEGDMRRSVMLLQSASRMLSANSKLTPTQIRELAGYIPDEVLDNLLKVWVTKDFSKISSALDKIVREGYSGLKLILQLNNKLIDYPHLTSIQKSKIAISIADTEKNLNNGSDEQLQILNMLVRPF